MLDLDALKGKHEDVKLDDVEYKVPRGMESMTLQAVAMGKMAMDSIKKLSQGSEDEDLTVEDVEKIHKFISAASTIPLDIISKKPLSVLSALITLMMKTDEPTPA